MRTKSILIPVSLARKIDLVARRRHITFDEAISFLLQKVEAPHAKARKGD